MAAFIIKDIHSQNSNRKFICVFEVKSHSLRIKFNIEQKMRSSFKKILTSFSALYKVAALGLLVASTTAIATAEPAPDQPSGKSRISRSNANLASRGGMRTRLNINQMRSAVATAVLSSPEDIAAKRKHLKYTWGKNDCSHFMQILVNATLGPLTKHANYTTAINQPAHYYKILKPYCAVSYFEFKDIKAAKKATKVNGFPDHALFAYRGPKTNHIFMIWRDKNGKQIIIENQGTDRGTYSEAKEDMNTYLLKRLSGKRNIKMLDMRDVKQFITQSRDGTFQIKLDDKKIDQAQEPQSEISPTIKTPVTEPVIKKQKIVDIPLTDAEKEFRAEAAKMNEKQKGEEKAQKMNAPKPRKSLKTMGAALKAKLVATRPQPAARGATHMKRVSIADLNANLPSWW